MSLALFLQKVLRQRRDISGPLSQRRHRNSQRFETFIKVCAKPVLFNFPRQIAVGSSDDANVHRDLFCPANPMEFACLNDAQKIRLSLKRHFPDFIKEKSAAIGLFKMADFLLMCIGKRTLLMSEKGTCHQVRRNGTTIHDNQLLIPPFAMAVQRLCNEFLAYPSLTQNKHRVRERCEMLNVLEHPQNLPTLADNV